MMSKQKALDPAFIIHSIRVKMLGMIQDLFNVVERTKDAIQDTENQHESLASTYRVLLEEMIKTIERDGAVLKDSTDHLLQVCHELASEEVLASHQPETQAFITKVLLVEDSNTAALALKMNLLDLNCEVDIAEDGEAALKNAEHNSYDLVIMDIGLPDISGIEVTKRIRQFTDPLRSHVPIVALTSYAGGHKREDCLEVGMNGVLTKPAQPMLLKLLLQRFVWDTKGAVLHPEPLHHTFGENVSDQEATIIDWPKCLELCQDDEAFADVLLETAVKELQLSQDLMERVLPVKGRHDVERLRAELHRCSGGLSYLSLPQLESALKTFKLSLSSDEYDADKINQDYAVLKNAMIAFWDMYERNHLSDQ